MVKVGEQMFPPKSVQTTTRDRKMRLDLCWKKTRPMGGSTVSRWDGVSPHPGSRGGTGHLMPRPLPDKPILSSTPERVGPHGCCGNALHPVRVVSKHVDSLLYCQVVDVHLGVSCSRNQDAVPSMRQELLRRD